MNKLQYLHNAIRGEGKLMKAYSSVYCKHPRYHDQKMEEKRRFDFY